MAKQLAVGSLCWYRDHDGSAKKVYIVEVNREVIPPKYYISIDGRKRESESLRLTLISPPQQALAQVEQAPQEHAQAAPAGSQFPSQPAPALRFPAGADGQWVQAAQGGQDASLMIQQQGGHQNGLQQPQYGHHMLDHSQAGQQQQLAPQAAQPYGAQMPAQQNGSWRHEYQVLPQQPQQQYPHHMAQGNTDLRPAPTMAAPTGMSSGVHTGYQVF